MKQCATVCVIQIWNGLMSRTQWINPIRLNLNNTIEEVEKKIQIKSIRIYAAFEKTVWAKHILSRAHLVIDCQRIIIIITSTTKLREEKMQNRPEAATATAQNNRLKCITNGRSGWRAAFGFVGMWFSFGIGTFRNGLEIYSVLNK